MSSIDDIIKDAYNAAAITETTKKSKKIKQNENTSEIVSNEDETEFKNLINQAVPVKTELLTENTKNMNDIKNEFASLVASKIREGKEDKELKQYYSKVFKNVKDYIYYQGGYPKEDSKGKGQKLAELLAMIVPWLQYLGEWDVIQKYLLEYGISIKTANPLENEIGFEFLKDNAMKNTIKGFFIEGKETQEKICKNTDSIISEYYDNLPESIKYDKHENPTGLKAAQFNKLVNIVAKSQIDVDKKDEIQDKAIFQLNCLTESTKLLKDSIINNN